MEIIVQDIHGYYREVRGNLKFFCKFGSCTAAFASEEEKVSTHFIHTICAFITIVVTKYFFCELSKRFRLIANQLIAFLSMITD